MENTVLNDEGSINTQNTENVDVTENTLEKLLDSFSSIIQTMSSFKSQITVLQQQLKILEKDTKRHVKSLERELKKRRPKGQRKPSGFAQPIHISKELCSFLKKPTGTQVARTEVTQHLIQYIKENNLQNQENKKVIIPDAKLKKLLSIGKSDELTFFNIQSYMNKHFVKE